MELLNECYSKAGTIGVCDIAESMDGKSNRYWQELLNIEQYTGENAVTLWHQKADVKLGTMMEQFLHLQRHAKSSLPAMEQFYLENMGNLLMQALKLFNAMSVAPELSEKTSYALHMLRALEKQSAFATFKVVPNGNEQQLMKHFVATICQLDALTQCAVDWILLDKLSDANGEILVRFALQIQELTNMISLFNE